MESTHIFVCLLALTYVSNVSSRNEVTKAQKDEEISLRQVYADIDKNVKNLVRENLKSVVRIFEENSHEFNLSTQCKGNAFKLLSGLRDLKFWAVNFVDASGKLSDGYLSGNFFMYGNYDQCLNATVYKKSGAVDFRGQYCMISVNPPLPRPELTPNRRDRVAIVKKLIQNLTDPLGFYVYKAELHKPQEARFGLCVPSGCGPNDVDHLIKYVGKKIMLNLTLEYCDTEDSLIYFTPTRIVIICIYSIFILLVIISSVIEQYYAVKEIKFENPLIKSLLSFSLPYNFRKFMSTKVTEENLLFLNGIRVLTLFYVILAHHYLLKIGVAIHRNFLSKFFYTWGPEFFFQILYNGFYTVDMFFFISGFLNCYLRDMKNFTSFSLSSSFKIFIHRLIRIYPSYIFVILLNLLFDPRGPIAHDIESDYWEPCKTIWWKNILFINNIYDPNYQCVPHSWYLAADTQFFLVSLFTVPLLFRHPKIGVFVNLVIILLSMVYTSVRVWTENLVPSVGLTMDISHNDFQDWLSVYRLPFPHAPAYFGGVLLGFLIAKKKKFNLSKITLVIGWIVASGLFITLLFISKRWNSGVPYTRLESALFISISRLIYSGCAGWLIFCCLTGRAGFINNILSWKLWIILNRLGLSAFLLSAILQLYYYGNLRTPQDFQHEIEIWSYFGDLAVTFLLSVPMMLLFESPIISLEKIIFRYGERTSGLNENEMKGKEIILHVNGTKSEKDKNSAEI